MTHKAMQGLEMMVRENLQNKPILYCIIPR